MAERGETRGNVLVVDDTPDNLKLLTHELARAGYEARPVNSGALALQGARRRPPELVLLDINMPGMNGYEVCERLKESPELRDIPVIFVSALDEVVDKVRAFAVGGVDFVTKPFEMEEVVARVETHLSLYRLRRERERLITELQQALAEVKQLTGIIPICADCKKVRDDEGYWSQVESYLASRTDAMFSHAICPDCSQKVLDELEEE